MCETGWDETRSEKPTQLKSALNRATAEKNNPFGVHDQFTWSSKKELLQQVYRRNLRLFAFPRAEATNIGEINRKEC